MSQTKRRQGNREKLLLAAITCLRDKGYAATTARDLVSISGANLASIGYHFGGMEGLMNAAVAETTRAWMRSIEEGVFAAPVDAPDEQLRRVFAASVDRFDELAPYLRSFVEAFPPAVRSSRLRAEMAAAYEDVRAAGAEMVERLVEGDARLGAEDARILSSLLIALGDGLILQWLLDPQATPSGSEIVGALERAAAAMTAADIR